MDYTPFSLGMNSKKTFVITINTPPWEIDETTTPDTVYMRYEDTTEPQLINRIQSTGGITRFEMTEAVWSDRVTAEYEAYIIGR